MGIKAEKSFSLADRLFNKSSVARLSANLAAAHRGFDRQKYEKSVLGRFPGLELKARIACLVDELDNHLPDDFNEALEALEAALPEPLDPNKTDDDFGEFIWAVPGEYVARHGCREDRLERSLAFLREATMRFTAEGPVRPFLQTFPARTMAFIHECAAHGNYHVRRLASEGIRPYLPWAPRVILPPEEVAEVLTRLHGDPTRYVTRSVANNLNDLSRNHPGLVMKTLESWRKKKRQDPAELAWMTRHALRTLVKADHARALEMLGYLPNPRFSVSGVNVSSQVRVGGQLEWRGVLMSKADQNLKIALRLHFLKANGTHSAKVFTIRDARLKKGEKIEIKKALAFKPVATRALYPGVHHVELLVNGVTRAKKPFELVA